jgi:porphyrinogen peroxidase
MSTPQPAILAPLPAHARFLYFAFAHGEGDWTAALQDLLQVADGERMVIGIGHSLALALDHPIHGLSPFPALSAPGIDIPSTQYPLWIWLRGEDRGDLALLSQDIEEMIGYDFRLAEVLEGFNYRDGRDLSGYIDGTENPQEEAAVAAAIVTGEGEGMDGSSFVAVQQWRHDMHHFHHLEEHEQDNLIGRRQSSNEEFDTAPPSAHVKRTAQESFSPPAWIVRRSMPWCEGNDMGLNFIAFGRSLTPYSRLLHRMIGAEDGIIDGLFSFSRPISGGYYWCPPLHNGKLDLRLLGIKASEDSEGGNQA